MAVDRKAPEGMFRLVCESPMDCEVYLPDDYIDLEEARKKAYDFAGPGDRFLNAFVYDDTGREVFAIDGGF